MVEGARQFQAGGTAYDGFMGRYSRPLAREFADFADVRPGQVALDVGCGPGALTAVLAERLGPSSVCAIDPTEAFVADCRARLPEVDVRLGRGEDVPFEDARFDLALSQLVLHFVSDADEVTRQFRRVLRPGGIAAACVWDFEEGMQMLRLFWDAALAVRPDAPDEARTLRFGREGEIADLLGDGGFEDVTEKPLRVSSGYADFDELWAGFLAGVGPAGAFCVSLDADEQAAVRGELYARIGEPTGRFTLHAMARAARGRAPA